MTAFYCERMSVAIRLFEAVQLSDEVSNVFRSCFVLVQQVNGFWKKHKISVHVFMVENVVCF